MAARVEGGKHSGSSDDVDLHADGRRLAYPEGWFQVGYSDELQPGEVQKLHYFGQELALFRTTSGKAQVLEAYCAHLGAHLGVGGKVVGERLACPFHAWEYGTSGACERIPYSDHIPARGATVRAWPTEERSGIIMVWHSPHDRAPSWEPPVLVEYDDPEWTEYVVRERRRVRTTAHEIAENIVDLPHIQFIHGGAGIPPADVTTEANVLTVSIRNDLPTVGAAQTNIVRLHGLGLILNHGIGIANKAGISANTPIDREHVEVRFSIAIRSNAPSDPTGELSLRSAQGTVKEFEKDIPIWENKVHRRVPTLCKDDGPIGRFRTWARQFY